MRQTKIKILFLFLGISFSLLFAHSVEASDISEQNVLRLINESRAKAGLPALEINEQLEQAANLKAQDMLDKKYFAHTSPDGKTPWYWFSKVKYDYEYAGENLAIDFVSAEAQNDAWMKSETHRNNILNSKYIQTGIAITVGEIENHNSIITVQVFASPKGVYEGGSKTVNSAPDKKINLENNSEGIVLSSKNLDSSLKSQGDFQSFDSWKPLNINQEKLDKFLWALVILAFAFMVVINPMILIEKSYENIYEIVRDKIRRYLIRLAQLEKDKKEKHKARRTHLIVKNMDEIKSIKLRV